jgi:hypothetical protein
VIEGVTKVELLQDVIHFAYKVYKRIFNCKITPIFVDKSRQERLPGQWTPLHEQNTYILFEKIKKRL